MNRREFLQFFGAATIAATVPGAVGLIAKEAIGEAEPKWNPEWDKFDPNDKYGNAVALSEDPTPEQKARLLSALETNMRQVIPPKYWKNVWYSERPFGASGTIDPFDELMYMFWKYIP